MLQEAKTMGWQCLKQKARELFRISSSPRDIFYVVTLTLLSLLLPLSFLLLARLSSAQFYLQNSLKWHKHDLPEPFPKIFSLFLQINPAVLYFLVSIVAAATLLQGLTGKVNLVLSRSTQSPVSQPRLYMAWILVCTFQVCVGLGIEWSIAAGIDGGGGGRGVERNFLSRAMFLLGLHETTVSWCRSVVRPVVDDTVFGTAAREERMVERAAVAASLCGLWWWMLREEAETLAAMAEAKKEMLMEVGLGDFAGWWLYYITVTIGMIRIVKGVMWMGMFLVCRGRRMGREVSPVLPGEDDDGKV